MRGRTATTLGVARHSSLLLSALVALPVVIYTALNGYAGTRLDVLLLCDAVVPTECSKPPVLRRRAAKAYNSHLGRRDVAPRVGKGPFGVVRGERWRVGGAAADRTGCGLCGGRGL